MSDLIELTASGVKSTGSNTLQLLHEIHVPFGLTPRQYLQWMKKQVRRGKCMMRRCLLCDDISLRCIRAKGIAGLARGIAVAALMKSEKCLLLDQVYHRFTI